MATTLRPWRPRESTRSPCGRQISEKRSSVWLQWGPCCARTALWRVTFVSPIAFPLRLLRQYDAHTKSSRRPRHALSATIGGLTAMLLRQWRRHYAAWALPSRLLRTYGVRTTILRRPSAFRCLFGSIPWIARMLSTHFLMQIRGFLSWKPNMISLKFESLIFK